MSVDKALVRKHWFANYKYTLSKAMS